jgi:hypothetical protein
VADALEGRAPRADHEHALAGAHELADRVDHGLRAAGARQRVHGERLSGGDAREHGLLLGIRIEQEPVGGGRALVGADGRGGRPDDRQILAVGLVAGEGVQDRVIEALGVATHRRRRVGERRHDQARLHREGVDVRGERAQVVDDRLRFEDAAVVGEFGERARRSRDRSACARRRRARG